MLPGQKEGIQAMYQTHAITQLMIKYADAHQGNFPTGASSTEVFQKLVEAEHLSPPSPSGEEIARSKMGEQDMNDTGIFYVKMPGKTVAASNVLRPENVCFDVTIPVDKGSPGELPVVFVTGYRVTYAPGGTAIPLFEHHYISSAVTCFDGSNYAIFEGIGISENRPYYQSNGAILNFIPARFDAAGKKYVQLTPNGPLGR